MSKFTVLHPPRQLVVFRVGQTRYGLDIESVDEISPVLPITETPGVPAGVLGIVHVRKSVLPVYDLHVKFGVPVPASNSEARLILVAIGDSPVALLVDAVEEVLAVQRDDFHGLTTPGSSTEVGYLNGVVRSDDRLILWIDHNRLIPGVVIAAAA